MSILAKHLLNSRDNFVTTLGFMTFKDVTELLKELSLKSPDYFYSLQIQPSNQLWIKDSLVILRKPKEGSNFEEFVRVKQISY